MNPVDLSPQYASVLTGVVRSGQLGATVSTGLAGALRQKVSHLHRRMVSLNLSQTLIELIMTVCKDYYFSLFI